MAGVMAPALQEVGSRRPLLGWVSPSPEAWRDVQGRIGWGAWGRSYLSTGQEALQYFNHQYTAG